MKNKNLITKLALASLLAALLITPVKSAFIYEGAKANDANIADNGFSASDNLRPNQFTDDFTDDVDSQTNKKTLETILGGSLDSNGKPNDNGLANPQSVINTDLGFKHIGLMEYYITSEDITEVNGVKTTYRDYFGLSKDIYFILQRVTSVAGGGFQRTQEYVIYTTNNITPKNGMVSPVYRTIITWTSNSTSFPYSDEGTYKINTSQLGYAPTKKITPRYVKDSSQASSKAVYLFDHNKWQKKGMDQNNPVTLSLKRGVNKIKVENLNPAWYKLSFKNYRSLTVKANEGVIITPYRMIKGELKEIKKVPGHIFTDNNKYIKSEGSNDIIYLKISFAINQEFTITI